MSTSGAELLPHDAIRELTAHLLPHTTVLTPNIPEARLILSEAGTPLSKDITSVDDLEAAGRRIQALGPKWVLVKGGHLPFGPDMTVAKTEAERKTVVDVLVGPEEEVVRVESPWQQSTSTHGTGCSLACGCPFSSEMCEAKETDRAQPRFQLVWPRAKTFRPLFAQHVGMSRRVSAPRRSSGAGTGR